ncbi:MAG: DUF4254 domain-containing protein [Flavobacteriales bacterium]|nr:DUF4254 domain-containing protein [Flavobacteriales bacterium]
MKAKDCNIIFRQCINDYHVEDNLSTPINNPFQEYSFEDLCYAKCWIDTVQWHLEDVIRDPKIEANDVVKIKREIDASNQGRVNQVEKIDDWFIHFFKDRVANQDARLNSESPAWIIDKLSILSLKKFHMQEQVDRTDVDEEHIKNCTNKLSIISEQLDDLSTCFDDLIKDINDGSKYMKVYRQVKMYNDPSLNPSLYAKEK